MHSWVDLQSVHRFCCYENSVECEMSASACTYCVPGVEREFGLAVSALIASVTLLCVQPGQYCDG